MLFICLSVICFDFLSGSLSPHLSQSLQLFDLIPFKTSMFHLYCFFLTSSLNVPPIDWVIRDLFLSSNIQFLLINLFLLYSYPFCHSLGNHPIPSRNIYNQNGSQQGQHKTHKKGVCEKRNLTYKSVVILKGLPRNTGPNKSIFRK